jgi:hypothetical protein
LWNQLSCVAYCDDGLATLRGLGKKEKNFSVLEKKKSFFRLNIQPCNKPENNYIQNNLNIY